jgi:hypothetical protein
MALANAVQGGRQDHSRAAGAARAAPGDDELMALADAVQRRRSAGRN